MTYYLTLRDTDTGNNNLQRVYADTPEDAAEQVQALADAWCEGDDREATIAWWLDYSYSDGDPDGDVAAGRVTVHASAPTA